MKHMLFLAGAAVLAACGGREAAESNVATADTTAPSEIASLNGTTWIFEREGKQIQESIDVDGNYIANAGEEHIDHGTYALVDGKQCFTSAMTDEGQVCWTTPANVAIGESIAIVSDEGEQLTVTRRPYVAMAIPS